MEYRKLTDLSENLQKFFTDTSIGIGLTDKSFDRAVCLLRDFSDDDLETLLRGDFAQQFKVSSENQLLRMIAREFARDRKLDVSEKEPIFIYTAEETAKLFDQDRTFYIVDSDTTIRAREEFPIKNFVGYYAKDDTKIKCDVTHVLLTDRVGLPPVVSSLKVKYGGKSKIISERSFRAYDDQWEIFFDETKNLMKKLYDIETSCYRKNLIDAVNDKDVEKVKEKKSKRKKKL